MQGADECVMGVFESAYTVAKKTYDSYNKSYGELLAVSALLVLFT